MKPLILKETVTTNAGFRAVMMPNLESDIYKAHFPGNPVLPGACLVQALHDLVEQHYGRKCRISEMKSVKFLSVIVPKTGIAVVFDVQCCMDSDNAISVKATIGGIVGNEQHQSKTVSELCIKDNATGSSGINSVYAKMSLLFTALHP